MKCRELLVLGGSDEGNDTYGLDTGAGFEDFGAGSNGGPGGVDVVHDEKMWRKGALLIRREQFVGLGCVF